MSNHQLADGCHQLTAVAYEGTSVATQTRISRNIVVKNTALTASLYSLPVGTNATLSQSLQFTVTANSTNLASIELFGTGGCQGVVTNQAGAVFTVPAAWFGQGLHPFYAVVSDQSGNRFQTATSWYDILPPITLTLSGTPLTLAWQAVPQRQYDVLFSTNLSAGFQTVATITATTRSCNGPLQRPMARLFTR